MISPFFIDEVIDLTNSQSISHNVPPTVLSNSIICIDSDDSFILSPIAERTLRRNKREQKNASKNTQKAVIEQSEQNQSTESKNSLGDCPICWNELGSKPIASTICGHVYCMECIRTSLCVEKRCPMCRTVLKGKLAYHPLYLPI